MSRAIFKSFYLIFLSSFFLNAADNDLKVINQNSNSAIYELNISNFELQESVLINNKKYFRVTFDNAVYPSVSNKYDLPSRALLFGIPANGDIRIEILSQKRKSYRNVELQMVDGFQETGSPANKTNTILEIGEKSRFRDIMTKTILFHPVSYNENSQTLALAEKITFRVTYSNVQQNNQFKSRGKLDAIYKDVLVNFEKSKNWQLPRRKSLQKTSTLGTGTFYGFSVTEDGLYKISASTVISVTNTDVINNDALQLFNNGGHSLSFATTSELYNPLFTQEVPVAIFDQNNNNVFDGNDYLLFYGKGVNGWFLDKDGEEFEHHTHAYDTKNVYYLSINGSNGKRMPVESLTEIPSAIEQNYFLDRYHFEEDKYNMLNSGPDWYGYRFFGTSNSYTVDFDLKTTGISGVQPYFEIQFKGESGVHYLDNDNYTYTFNVFLNNENIVNNLVFTKANRRKYTRFLNDASTLQNGSNSLRIQYSSNLEASSAHLDYFNLTFPRALIATDDYLSFYTEPQTTDMRYRISGLNNADPVYLFDVTDPLKTKILSSNLNISNGTARVDIGAGSGARKLIASNLSSSGIKSISKLAPYSTNNNLLDPSKQADFIIITSKSLLNYGKQIADLRDHLKTEVVSVSDIYFYFNSGVADPTAIRNFIRYAYYNWQTPSISYVLLFGDGHFDYRNIQIADSNVVPTFQIYGVKEVNFGTSESRESDLYFAQLENSDDGELQSTIHPSIAIGRLPVENALDAERVVEKLRIYKENPIKDGWQTAITVVGDDEKVSNNQGSEWIHQSQAESIAKKSTLQRFNINKIYLSAYEGIPGGRGTLKPKATQELIDRINRGTLILNYVGHGSPTTWAHETVFNFERDYSKLNNEARFPFIVAATCDFGLFDNPNDVSFTEAMIWKEKSGSIGTIAATRLVYSGENFAFSNRLFNNLFPGGGPSIPLGEAFVKSISTFARNINDQKYHLLGDPSMTLADPREEIEITSITPDTLKALSKVNVKARVKINDTFSDNFQGGAVIIMNDAVYEDVNTGGGENYNYTLSGPLVFKGEVSVNDGILEGNFIIPKSIRYKNKNTGRITLYGWDDNTNLTALGYRNDLLMVGSSSISQESDGPEIDIYFEGQENFSSGDIISSNPILVAELSDESGINMTGQLGHKIELRINENEIIDISESFSYERDSFTKGFIHYPLTSLEPGQHTLALQAYDNLNNRSEQTIQFNITESTGLVLADVVNYPNPFRRDTRFTFQTNAEGAEATVKIYTISGRIIEKLEGYITKAGYNEIEWSGLDRDGNSLANGVYLYKIIIKDAGKSKEKIEKLVVIQ